MDVVDIVVDQIQIFQEYILRCCNIVVLQEIVVIRVNCNSESI